MKTRIAWRRPKRSPKGDPLPRPSVYLQCRQSGDWVGDVLWRPPGKTFWRGSRYHVFLSDEACVAGHVHVPPTEAEVAEKVAAAESEKATVVLRVKVKR